jgi:peptide/nickel transport system substrate-binding protein
MNMPILRDNPAIRQALAWAVDYDMINANAMTGQSPTFTEVPRSLMAPPPGEQALYNQSDVAHLQWVGRDYDAANALLDEAGFTERDAQDFRTHDGQRLSFRALCPAGWTDWEAAMEIVAAAGVHIGIEITTEFPEWDVYQTVVTADFHDDYEIFMMWTSSTDPTSPWSRARILLSSEFIGQPHNWSGNWGHYSNPRADDLIMAIPLESDESVIRGMFTELVEIYLTDVPSFSLMYRPDKFHAVNESVWTGFTDANDGRNVPPINAISGYAIADLYNIRLVNP